MKDSNNRNSKISLKTISIIVGIVVGFMAIFSYINLTFDGKVASHPAVVKLQAQQENTQESLKRIEEQLKQINQKVDKLGERKR